MCICVYIHAIHGLFSWSVRLAKRNRKNNRMFFEPVCSPGSSTQNQLIYDATGADTEVIDLHALAKARVEAEESRVLPCPRCG